MSNPSGPLHRSVSNIRSPLSANAGAPASPHTPLRTVSSTFGSPSALRAEEDCVVIELGARYLRAGFAGDATPKAVVDFGPEEQRRAGNLRRWEVDYKTTQQRASRQNGWGGSYELWKPDLRGLDLGLVGDKIERAVREVFTKNLLIDSRPRRVNLVIPSALPLPLLSTILDTLFTNFHPPTISLMSESVLTTVAAGLRSGLVVDIGWAETVVTAVYEYREVQCHRSIRAMKLFGDSMFEMLAEAIHPVALRDTAESVKETKTILSFDECEDVLIRMAWCKSRKGHEPATISQGLTPVKEEDESEAITRSLNINRATEENPDISIPLSSTVAPMTLRIPFLNLAEPCEKALFAARTKIQDLDDEELPLHLLIYQSLLHLPVDVRSICMARIMFVGGGANIPGLKGRIMDEIASLIETQAWDRVTGVAVEQLRNNPKLQRTRARQLGPTEIPKAVEATSIPMIPARLVEQEADPIEEQFKREARKGLPGVESGVLRAIDTLGAWSGGSLLSQLKIPAVSIVDRDQWLQHGISGASKSWDVNYAAQRQSLAPGTLKSGAADRSSWTLGPWG